MSRTWPFSAATEWMGTATDKLDAEGFYREIWDMLRERCWSRNDGWETGNILAEGGEDSGNGNGMPSDGLLKVVRWSWEQAGLRSFNFLAVSDPP